MPNRTCFKNVKNKVIYISNDYFSLEELKENVVIRADFSDELLGKYWNNYNFEKAEKRNRWHYLAKELRQNESCNNVK